MIIVTGGAGFIGSNLLHGLEKIGKNDLVVCDWAGSDDRWKNFAKRTIRDFVSPDNLFEYLEKNLDDIEAIFHMGAISSTTEYDVDKIIRYNFDYSCRLWDWCSDNRVRFIYASSAATYGDGTNGFNDAETPEDLAKLRPLNPYGWSKHAFDRRVSQSVYVNQIERRIPPQWAGLKFFNVYGPNEYHKSDMSSLICKLYPKIKAGESAKLFKSHKEGFADGEQSRDFVYIDDCVSVMLWLLENHKVSGLFNVGSGIARSFRELAELTFIHSEIEPNLTFVDMPEILREKYQYYTKAEMTKLRNAGYDKPVTSLEDGIKAYVKDYMSTADKYK